MNASDIAKSIYNLVLSFDQQDCPPIAYINVSVGQNCLISDEELYEAFNKQKWNTALSCAELNIERSADTADDNLIVTGIEDFEDENGNSEHLEFNTEEAVIKIS